MRRFRLMRNFVENKQQRIMAVLKIYNDIQSDGEKSVARLFGDAEGVSFKDVDEFCESIAPGDGEIDLRLHCDGGSVLEGWAIYDRIRATGKRVSATVEGNAASMATVIMMAAPKERRRAYASAQVCVHNPWMSRWDLQETLNAGDLQKLADGLRSQQDKIVSLYVERCGCGRDEIQALMDEDRYIGASEAMRYGLIGSIIQPISAKKTDMRKTPDGGKKSAGVNSNNQKNREKMAKDEDVKVKRTLLDRILAKAGIKSIKDPSVYGMELNTTDGGVLTIQREEGAPAVGDAAEPDGTWPMPDGTTIVIENGVITEIRPAEGDGDGDGDGKKGDGSAGSGDDLQAQVDALEKRVSELEDKLKDAKDKARTPEDLRVLNAVRMAGGLDKVMAKFSSAYKPQPSQPDGSKAQKADPAGRDFLKERIDELRKKK